MTRFERLQRGVPDLVVASVITLLQEAGSRFLWSPSPSREPVFGADLFDQLDENWGRYRLFAAWQGPRLYAVYAVYDMAPVHGRGYVFVACQGDQRNGLGFPLGWIRFLEETQAEGLANLYARVHTSNRLALHSIEHFGFSGCGALPRYFRGTAGFEDVLLFHRTTALTRVERRLARRWLAPSRLEIA